VPERELTPSGKCSGTCRELGKADMEPCRKSDEECEAAAYPECASNPRLCELFKPICPLTDLVVSQINHFNPRHHPTQILPDTRLLFDSSATNPPLPQKCVRRLLLIGCWNGHCSITLKCIRKVCSQFFKFREFLFILFCVEDQNASCSERVAQYNSTMVKDSGTGKMESCEVCLCQCLEPVEIQGNKESVRLFSLKESSSLLEENRVIVGIKFEQLENQIHIMVITKSSFLFSKISRRSYRA